MQHQDLTLKALEDRLQAFEVAEVKISDEMVANFLHELKQYEQASKQAILKTYGHLGFTLGIAQAEKQLESNIKSLRKRLEAMHPAVTVSSAAEAGSSAVVAPAALPSAALQPYTEASALSSSSQNNAVRYLAIAGAITFFAYVAREAAPPEWLDYVADGIRKSKP